MFEIEFTLCAGGTDKYKGNCTEVLEQMDENLRLYSTSYDLTKTKLIVGTNEIVGFDEIYQSLDRLRGKNELFKYNLYRLEDDKLLLSGIGNVEYIQIAVAETYESDVDCNIVLQTYDSLVSTTQSLYSDDDWYCEIEQLCEELSQKRNLV